MIKAARQAKKTLNQAHLSVSDCESMQDDLTALKSWASIFTDVPELVKAVGKHMVFHKSEIMDDAHMVSADWSQGMYFASGKAAADLMTVAIGPVKEAALLKDGEPCSDDTDCPISGLQYCGEDGACHSKCAANDFLCMEQHRVGMDLLELPKMAAGFAYGMVGDNHLSEFEACYAGVQPLEGFLMNALNDLEQFHIIAAMKEFEKFVYHFQLDVAPCHHMSDDVAAIEAWAQIFKNPTQLVETATKHYLLHKKHIKTDIADIKADQAASEYFKTGEEAADILTILLGPIE